MPIHFASATILIDTSFSGRANLVMPVKSVIDIGVALSGAFQTPPRVLGAVAINSLKIRVTFDQPMAKNSLLTALSSYLIFPLDSDTANVFINSAEAEAVDFPSYVDLNTTEMTGGKLYRLVVESGAGAPQSRYGTPLNAIADTADFTGIGVRPTIKSVVAQSANRVDVIFSEPMFDNDAIRDADRYVFDNGLTVTSVLEVSGDTVKLATTDQVAGLLYTLTIT